MFKSGSLDQMVCKRQIISNYYNIHLSSFSLNFCDNADPCLHDDSFSSKTSHTPS